MLIIAQRGEQYLVKETDETGRIVDLTQQLVSPIMDIQVILKWGYWEEPENTSKPQIDKLYNDSI